MAKGIGLIGNVSGKLGNTVGYTIKNSKSKETQGWRIYQPKVTNPQSFAQMAQRVKMTAINNFYRALRSIIQRGMEGVQYGDPSRREWLKMAMGSEFRGPYLVKGDTTAVPMTGVKVTRGSLPPVTFAQSGGDLSTKFVSNIAMDGDDTKLLTVGGVSQFFINAGYKLGDQVTFILANDNGGYFGYRVVDFILDPSDARSLEDTYALIFANFTGKVGFDFANNDGNIVGIACSVSRDGDGSHLRSDASFSLMPSVIASYYNYANIDSVMQSYASGDAATTDWPQVPTRGASGQTATTTRAALRDATLGTAQIVTISGFQQFGGYTRFLNAAGAPVFYAYGVRSTNVGAYYSCYVAQNQGATTVKPSDASEVNTLQLGLFTAAEGTTLTDEQKATNEFTQWAIENGAIVDFR